MLGLEHGHQLGPELGDSGTGLDLKDLSLTSPLVQLNKKWDVGGKLVRSSWRRASGSQFLHIWPEMSFSRDFFDLLCAFKLRTRDVKCVGDIDGGLNFVYARSVCLRIF